MEMSYIRGPSYNGGVQFKTFSDTLKYTASLIPDRDAFVVYHSVTHRESITFSGVYEESSKFAASLIALGINSRDKLVFHLRNSIELVTAQFGLLMMGGIPVNIDLTSTGNAYLLEVIQEIKPVALILEKSFLGTTRDLQNLKLACSSLKYIIVTDIYEDNDVCLSYHKLLKIGLMDEMATSISLNPRDVALINRTSGTTGKPKYITFSNESFLSLETGARTTINGNALRKFSTANFLYTSGYPLLTLIRGITRVTMHCESENAVLSDMLNIVEKERCNWIGLSPTKMKKIIARQLHIPEMVKVIGVGGEPLTKDIGKLLDQVYCVCCHYGTLEVGPIASFFVTKHNQMENNIGGYPNNNVEVKIIDEENRVVKRGITGEIFARTPVSCLSITKDDGEGEHTVHMDDWIDTGDVGYISNEGKLYVLGRNMDSVTIGSFTAHITDVETIFRAIGINGIEELVVLLLPEEEYHQRVCVWIIRTPGAELTESQFLDICKKSNIVPDLMPKHIIFMNSFPMTASGKLRRNVLLEQVINDLLPEKE